MANSGSDKLQINKSIMDSLRSIFPARIFDRIYNNCTLDKTDIVEIKIGLLLANLTGFTMMAVSVFAKDLNHPFDWIFGTLGVMFAMLKMYSYFLDVRKKHRDYYNNK